MLKVEDNYEQQYFLTSNDERKGEMIIDDKV